MYKLFLCLRYLRRRYIALVAIVGMALCVFMVLVVVSVFNGFLDMVQSAARGMMGDVIIDVAGGLPHYDPLLEEVRTLPEVTASTPVIYAYALLRVGPRYTHPVRVVGLRLPEAAAVSTFAQGLYPEGLKGNPRFEVPPPYDRLFREQAVEMEEYLRQRLEGLEREAGLLEERLRQRMSLPSEQRDRREIESIQRAIDAVREERESLPGLLSFDPEHPRIILGVDIPGTTRRDSATGEYERMLTVGRKVTLTVIPIARGVTSLTESRAKIFTYVGDSRMGIYGVDNVHVYVDFDVLQPLVDMGAVTDVETGITEPGYATQAQIKLGPVYLGAPLKEQGGALVIGAVVAGSPADEAGLQAGDRLTGLNGTPVKSVDDARAMLAGKRPGQSLRLGIDRAGGRRTLTARLADPRGAVEAVKAVYAEVATRLPDMPRADEADIQTWEQKQQSFIEPIEKQRTLTAIMFSIISLVAVVLVFAIFYMMVVQRTRDVGVLKSIGGSSAGVAAIYLLYGTAIGLVGSAAGAAGGCLFVRHINPIHDWVADTFGYRLFDRQAYLFDTIPNQVSASVVAMVIVGAMLAGLIGAMLPALRAARMQPVEALRYE